MSNLRAVAVLLLIIIAALMPSAAGTLNTTPQGFPSTTWNAWAGVAWRYWNNCYNPTTGLTFDACTYHFFSLWGLASNILGLVAANKLGLVSDFNTRVDLILNFLNTMSLTSGGIPYSQYSSDTKAAATTAITDASDYGRLLLAEYVLKQYLIQLGDATRASKVDSAVGRVGINSLINFVFLSTDLYSYYATLGYILWGLQVGLSVSGQSAIYAVQGDSGSKNITVTSRIAGAQNGFQNLMENGPFVPSTSMFGVSGIPANTRIDGEPFVNAILEVGDQPAVVGLPSWSDFTQLSNRVYTAQEGRHSSTHKPEFWTEGGLDFSPGFLYEWIVWTTGATWVVLNNNGSPFKDSRAPVAFAKLMFAYSALYDTTYTTTMLNTYADSLETSQGFEEGVYATGAFDTNVQIQTNQIILLAASYVANHSVPSGQAPPSFSLSCGSLPPGASCSFNSASGPLILISSLTITTSPSTPLGCYSITVKATGGGSSVTTQVTLGVIPSTQGVEGMGPYVKDACSKTVSLVLPDYTGPYHTPIAKCGGVNAAQLSDYSAGGYVLGLLSNPQSQFLDTSPSISQTSCGNPTGFSNTIAIVTLAGPGVNEVVHYYEQVAGITPVYYLWDGTKSNFVVRATGLRYNVPNTVSITTPGDDLFLIEAFVDAQARQVFALYGFSWQGTLAAGVFFSDFVAPQLSQFQNSWYIYEWRDASAGASHNSFPDPADSYTLIATSGPSPSLTATSDPPSGTIYTGFAGISKDVLGAGQNSVYFILPDYIGAYHSPASKCGGVNAAALSDYSAGGYLLSSTTNFQYEVLDTSNSINSTSGSCGSFLNSTSVIVTIAGPGVNEAVHYYEQVNGGTPVYYLWDGSRSNFVVRATGVRYKVPNAGATTISGDDLFLLESFVDAQGRHVYVLYGFSWQGTLAAATFLNTYVQSHLSSFTNSWYIYEWKNAVSGPSANSFPDQGDIFNLIATG